MPNLGSALAGLAVGDGADIAVLPGCWAVNNLPATATQATISKAARTDGGRHICTAISVAIAAGSTAQTAPVVAVLRDGASGAGTILWQKALTAPASQTASIDISGLSIVGSPNTAMTLEFTGAGGTGTQQSVALSGFDVTT